MKKILVGYITHSGTTRDVAEAIAEEIGKAGCEAELLPMDEVKSMAGYDAVVLGAPMIVGWHRSALAFLRSRKAELESKPLALFLTGMALTDGPRPELGQIRLHLDEKLLEPSKKPGRLGFKESFTTIKHYLQPVLAVSPKSLAAVGFFGGRMDFYRLKWYEALFVMVVVGAKPGEKRNWADIRAWAGGLPSLFNLA